MQVGKEFPNHVNSSRWVNKRGAVKCESANTQHLAYEVLEHELRLTWLRNKRYTNSRRKGYNKQ
jgi:hypothetical protein